MRSILPFLLLTACWGDDAYIVDGVVVQVNPPYEVVIAHEDIPRLMGAMTMPFEVHDAGMLDGIEPGHRVHARLIIDERGSRITKIRARGRAPIPADALPSGPSPVRPGQVLPATELPLASGGSLTVGAGQARPTVVTWLYTTCPIPEMCPAAVLRLQALQQAVGADAHLVAVTLDPKGDTPEVLAAFAESVGADPDVWTFARLEGDALSELALRSAIAITSGSDGEIVHGTRWLVLDRDGRLVERYDDNRFPLDRVVQQLRTGEPAAPRGSDGTVTPRE